jgi:hypothetical protein
MDFLGPSKTKENASAFYPLSFHSPEYTCRKSTHFNQKPLTDRSGIEAIISHLKQDN